jgi:hypothetical protein
MEEFKIKKIKKIKKLRASAILEKGGHRRWRPKQNSLAPRRLDYSNLHNN